MLSMMRVDPSDQRFRDVVGEVLERESEDIGAQSLPGSLEAIEVECLRLELRGQDGQRRLVHRSAHVGKQLGITDDSFQDRKAVQPDAHFNTAFTSFAKASKHPDSGIGYFRR